jgi:hypothetical protein
MFAKAKNGKDVFRTVCKAFDFKDIKCKADETALQIYSVFNGDDLPISLIITIDDASSSVDFRCKLAFEAPMSSYNDVLTQLNMLNNSLRFGSFMLDPESGWLLFKYGYIYINARPSEELVLSLVSMVVQTVDEHDGDLKRIIPVNTNIPDPMFG